MECATIQVYSVFDWGKWRALGAYVVLPIALFIAFAIWCVMFLLATNPAPAAHLHLQQRCSAVIAAVAATLRSSPTLSSQSSCRTLIAALREWAGRRLPTRWSSAAPVAKVQPAQLEMQPLPQPRAQSDGAALQHSAAAQQPH